MIHYRVIWARLSDSSMTGSISYLGMMDGDPSLEKQAGDSTLFSWQASFSPGVSPTPSDQMVITTAPSRPGPSHPPSVLGVKCSPPPASPSHPPLFFLISPPPLPLLPTLRCAISRQTGGTGLWSATGLLAVSCCTQGSMQRMSRISCLCRLRT